MMSLTKLVRLTVFSLGLATLLAGCGGTDNEKGMMTNTDGTTTKVEGGGGSTSPSDYMKKAKAESDTRSTEPAKGYPKR